MDEVQGFRSKSMLWLTNIGIMSTDMLRTLGSLAAGPMSVCAAEEHQVFGLLPEKCAIFRPSAYSFRCSSKRLPLEASEERTYCHVYHGCVVVV
jgi:hypothetical protein